MAKSLRAKTKQANRRKKRQDEGSYYAAVEAARLKAVSDRLLGKEKKEGDDEEMMEDDDVEGGAEGADGSGEGECSDSGYPQLDYCLRPEKLAVWRAQLTCN